jgi:UDP-2,3-diacylglucosamine pyrophosphatase LpxH
VKNRLKHIQHELLKDCEDKAPGNISRAEFLKMVVCQALPAAALLGFSFSGCAGNGVTSIAPSSTTHDSTLLDDLFGISTGSSVRSLVVAISDLHLGDQRSINDGYGWLIKNESSLEAFLNLVASGSAIKELVIAGDLFDEWVIPMTYDTFNGFGPDQAGESKFFDSMVAAHPGVVTALNKIIAAGIKVTYIPGNHDMLVTEADMNRAFPGIRQKRDTPGTGTYSPEGFPEIVIEHSHRYDFSAAPDMYSNRVPYSPVNYTDNAAAILPPGFFATRIGASAAMASPGGSGTIPQNLPAGNYALYWAAWQLILNQVPGTIDRNVKQIKTGVDGYTGVYAINDLVPQLAGQDLLPPMLYQGIEDNWNNRQLQNKTISPISVLSGIIAATLYTWDDDQSKTQYFSKDPGTRVVIFGHTHHAALITSTNVRLQKCICANSGTWVDKGNPACTFVVMNPQAQSDSVDVYQYTGSNTATKLYGDHIMKG